MLKKGLPAKNNFLPAYAEAPFHPQLHPCQLDTRGGPQGLGAVGDLGI